MGTNVPLKATPPHKALGTIRTLKRTFTSVFKSNMFFDVPSIITLVVAVRALNHSKSIRTSSSTQFPISEFISIICFRSCRPIFRSLTIKRHLESKIQIVIIVSYNNITTLFIKQGSLNVSNLSLIKKRMNTAN